MKPSLTYLKNHLVCFGAAVFLLVAATAAKAQVLLTVNLSNPDQIIITATGNLASGTSTADFFDDGFDLTGLFTTSTGFQDFQVVSSTLTLSNDTGGTQTFTQTAGDDVTGAVPSINQPDLNLFHNHTADQMDFNATAFSGSITIDLSKDSSGNSTSFSTANISMAGGNVEVYDTKEVVGTYAVSAPEPQTWAMLIAGVTLFGLLRLRSQRS